MLRKIVAHSAWP